MKSYRYSVPTPVYYGNDCVKQNAALLCSFGKRAFIVTSKFLNNCPNYALDDVEEVFKANGIDYAVNDEVEENPPVESCAAITKIARAYEPDFIVGIGGGSALDTAKAVNFLLGKPEDKDPYESFFGGKGGSLYGTAAKPEGKLPLVGIPTTAGTGSEVTGGAVLTRADTDTKDTPPHRIFFDVAFMDVRYIKESPSFLIHTGAMDALAHGVETYVNTASNFMNRSMAEIGFRLFADFKDHKVKLLTGHKIISVGDGGALVENIKTGEQELLEADNVVFAIGLKPKPSMVKELMGSGIEVHEIGDGKQVSNIRVCTSEAYEVARKLY